VVIDQTGYPVCTEVWPDNTADVTTLLPVAERLKLRFNIEKVCIVGDRGMISKNTIKSLLHINWSYILGAKMRNAPDMKEIFADDSPYVEVTPPRQKSTDRAPLKVKEVYASGNRYIVCLNDEEAKKDRHTREEIVNKLSQALKSGDKKLIANKRYKRYLGNSKNNFTIDEDKVKEKEKYDGIFVLKTNLDLPAPEIALQYKQLLTVETIFRTTKSILETWPIYHQRDETIRGHIWCSYLAILLKKTLNDLLSPCYYINSFSRHASDNQPKNACSSLRRGPFPVRQSCR
jgi:transposase